MKTDGHTNKLFINIFRDFASKQQLVKLNEKYFGLTLLKKLKVFTYTMVIHFNDVSGLATSQEMQKWTVDLSRCYLLTGTGCS